MGLSFGWSFGVLFLYVAFFLLIRKCKGNTRLVVVGRMGIRGGILAEQCCSCGGYLGIVRVASYIIGVHGNF